MANPNARLMTFLQQAPGAIYIPPGVPLTTGPLTTSASYSRVDVTQVRTWDSFNLGRIRQRYQQVLNVQLIPRDDPPASPPGAVNSEDMVRDHVTTYFKDRVRRALRAAFIYGTAHQQTGLTEVSFAHGTAARTTQHMHPDLAFFSVSQTLGMGDNRAPGEIKPSWKWGYDMWFSNDPNQQQEFRQGLSQVQFYMRQNHTRSGFIVTNDELVVIRRMHPTAGHLEIRRVLWETRGTYNQPQLTVLMALWYLGMLAAEDGGHYNQYM